MIRLIIIILILCTQTASAQVRTAMWDQEIPAEQYFQYAKPQVKPIQSYQYQYVDPNFIELLDETEQTIYGQPIPSNIPIEDRLTALEQYLRIPVSYGVNPKVRLENILCSAVNIAQQSRQQQIYIPQQNVYNNRQPVYNQPYRPSYDPGRYGDPYDYRGGTINTIIQVLPSVLDLFRRQRY